MSHLDQSLLDELRELMEDDFSVLLEAYLMEAPIQRQAIESALSDGDAEALRRSAHSLKGSSSNIGAAGLAEHCRRLEELAHQAEREALTAMLSALVSEYEAVYQEITDLT